MCIFRVGGVAETSLCCNEAVPRWEFFIGDEPHEKCDEEMNFRPPMQQIASIEADGVSGDVVVSQETAEVRAWDADMLYLHRAASSSAPLIGFIQKRTISIMCTLLIGFIVDVTIWSMQG